MKHIWIKYYKDGILEQILSFREAELKIKFKIKKLLGLGIKTGDRVIVKMENSIDTIITYLSLLRINAVAIPVNPKEAKDKINFIIKDCGPKAIISADENVTIISNSQHTSHKQVIEARITTIIYTSGTTGTPKGVCLSWKNWESNAKSLITHHKLNKDTVLATPLPLFHCNAHGLAMYSTYIAKSTLILFNKTPENFLEILNSENVNIASVVPAILSKTHRKNSHHIFGKKFKYFLSAAAPLGVELLKSILKDWKVVVIQGYGLSESTNFSCTLPTNLSISMYKKIMLPNPSIGVALPGVKIILNSLGNKGSKKGELLINSKSNSIGYWPMKLNDKFICTGDVGYAKKINNKIYFYLKGRLKEIINRGGEKLYPRDIEQEIKKIDKNLDIHVFSIRNKDFGEEVALATIKKFNTLILNKIPYYRRPKKVYLMREFFTTTTGKIQRSKLRSYCELENKGCKLIWRNQND